MGGGILRECTLRNFLWRRTVARVRSQPSFVRRSRRRWRAYHHIAATAFFPHPLSRFSRISSNNIIIFYRLLRTFRLSFSQYYIIVRWCFLFHFSAQMSSDVFKSWYLSSVVCSVCVCVFRACDYCARARRRRRRLLSSPIGVRRVFGGDAVVVQKNILAEIAVQPESHGWCSVPAPRTVRSGWQPRWFVVQTFGQLPA